MAKNKSLVFGDVIKDPSNGTLYVAVSGTTALKINKQYTLFLKITEEFNYLCTQLFPYDRTSVCDFIFIKNIHDSIDCYVLALNIKHNKSIVKSHGFYVKKTESLVAN